MRRATSDNGTAEVYYRRAKRFAGESKYPLSKMLSLGIVGEYVGRIYMESKHRPRYIVAEELT